VGCISDPYIDLDRAEWLLRMNRPIPAEPLIMEGKAEYEKQGNQLGIGLADQDYGILLTMDHQPLNRFMDKSVTLDNRLAKGTEYFDQSLQHFRLQAEQDLNAGNYARLYYAYIDMAITYHYLKDKTQACASMTKAVDAADENDRRNPHSKAPKSHREKMRTFLAEHGCDEEPRSALN
jgi:hypothetical protein